MSILYQDLINPAQVQIEGKPEHRRLESFAGHSIFPNTLIISNDDLLSQHYERVMNRDQKDWNQNPKPCLFTHTTISAKLTCFFLLGRSDKLPSKAGSVEM